MTNSQELTLLMSILFLIIFFPIIYSLLILFLFIISEYMSFIFK
jgi:hypothetical protein